MLTFPDKILILILTNNFTFTGSPLFLRYHVRRVRGALPVSDCVQTPSVMPVNRYRDKRRSGLFRLPAMTKLA